MLTPKVPHFCRKVSMQLECCVFIVKSFSFRVIATKSLKRVVFWECSSGLCDELTFLVNWWIIYLILKTTYLFFSSRMMLW